MAHNTRQEQACLARQDAKALYRMADALRAFDWEVNKGREGVVEMEKSRECAKDVLKRVVNYI